MFYALGEHLCSVIICGPFSFQYKQEYTVVFCISSLLVSPFILFYITSSTNCWIVVSSKAAIAFAWKPGNIATNFHPNNSQKCRGTWCTMLPWRYVPRPAWGEQSPADEASAEGSFERGRFSDPGRHSLWLPSILWACSATRCSTDSSESGQGSAVQGNDTHVYRNHTAFPPHTLCTQFVWGLNKHCIVIVIFGI